MLTDDMSASFPISKDHVVHFDKNKTGLFQRTMGERAAVTDKKLGIDYDVYNKLNHQAQRTALKAMEVHRQLQTTTSQKGQSVIFSAREVTHGDKAKFTVSCFNIGLITVYIGKCIEQGLKRCQLRFDYGLFCYKNGQVGESFNGAKQ